MGSYKDNVIIKKDNVMSKYVWIMSATSESGDDYNPCGVWDYKPSQDEINRIRAKLDATEFDPKFDDASSENFIKVDGKEYITYILRYHVDKVKVTSK